ncbi:MAG: hypothetical protein ACRC2H_09775 [Silanimonas sp.]
MSTPPERASHAARFPAHGALERHATEASGYTIVYINATGPFNREMVDRVRDVHTPNFAAAAANGPYAHISTFHGSMLATPEAFEAFAALVAEWRAMGILPAANAYVAASDVEGRTFVADHYRRAWADTPCEVFERREDAEAWVAGVLGDGH